MKTQHLTLIILLLAAALQMNAVTSSDLFYKYKQAGDEEKTAIANELMKQLKKEGVTDSLFYFGEQVSDHKVDFQVYNLMATSYSNRELYDSAYICCQMALNQTDKVICTNTYRKFLDKMWEIQHSYHAKDIAMHEQLLKEENENQKSKMRNTIIIFTLALLLLASLLVTVYHSLRNRIKANAMMKSHNDMKLDFFTKVAHEFRTPLTLIIGLSDNISSGRASTPEEVKRASQIIKHNGYQMQRLTNQLLELARMRSDFHKLDWCHGNIVAYTQMIVDSFTELAKDDGITLHYLPAQKEADVAFVPDFHNKILNNLISNSIKYTPSGGNILVETSVDGNQLHLSVTDTGYGIPEDKMDHIFDEFYTSNLRKSNISSGVGLALVKQMVDCVGGKINVMSTVGKGTRFIINLPLPSKTENYPHYELENNKPQSQMPEPEKPAPVPEDDDDEGRHKPRILIVEDNKDVKDYIGSLLHDKYNIIYAQDGKEGLRIANEQVPDLIVSDLMMLLSDGLQLCREIRASELLSHIPFIMVTAKTTEEDQILGIQAGADAYITKPFNPNVLDVRVEQLIAQRQKLRERFSKAIKDNTSTPANVELSDTDRTFIEHVTNVVRHEMAAGNVDVETIASIMCLSSKQLRRKIFAITGETTVAFIMHIRLEEARNILVNDPDIAVSEVAMKCGFEDGGYFAKAFKQKYKITPSQMRKGSTKDE